MIDNSKKEISNLLDKVSELYAVQNELKLNTESLSRD